MLEGGDVIITTSSSSQRPLFPIATLYTGRALFSMLMQGQRSHAGIVALDVFYAEISAHYHI